MQKFDVVALGELLVDFTENGTVSYTHLRACVFSIVKKVKRIYGGKV